MAEKARQILIIGAGPAGLTAALELLKHNLDHVTLIEQDSLVGGISRTIEYHGNRMDLGGHRFFSKSDEVMAWWRSILPLENTHDDKGTFVSAQTTDRVMLERSRLSRIYYLRKFFSYPVTLSIDTLKNLGLARTVRIGLSYLKACVKPIKPENNLEDFFINRFGHELYATFFRDYTEKVWGIQCKDIAADWGAQRIKGLSILNVLKHALKHIAPNAQHDISQKDVETSLIDKFWYPKLGPGSLWETVADSVCRLGGQLRTQHKVVGLDYDEQQQCITAVSIQDLRSGQIETIPVDVVISSMPLNELIRDIQGKVPSKVQEVAAGLVYRDFITVGVLLRRSKAIKKLLASLKDNWIYVQESDVHMGRIQIFNNWSPWLVADEDTIWLGLEYFCNEGDAFWTMSDEDFIKLASEELVKLDLASREDILDATLIRVPKAYPGYFGSYKEISCIQEWLNGIKNLYPVGRNGMHRYNNMDHSMLSAMRTVDCLMDSHGDKASIWTINTEQQYHETKQNTENA